MNVGVISMRYTRALLKYATLNGDADKVYAEMGVLAQSYIDVPRLRTSLDNPVLSDDRKIQLCETACGGSVCDSTRNFFALVLKSGRINLLQFMANSYVDLYRKQNNITRGKLITAVSVSSDMRERMCKMVEERTHNRVEFVTEVDPSIIGGFILEYDNNRLDSSISATLRRTLQQLNVQ